MGYIILNGVKSTEKGLLLKNDYNIPIANETLERISVLGRKEGDLTIRTGSYPDLTFTLEFILRNWKDSSSEIKSLIPFFFANTDNKLFVNNEEYYYEIVSKEIGELNYKNGRAIIIPVTFTTKPFLKLKDDTPVTGNEILNRGIIESEPLININSSTQKTITVTCNGQEFIIEPTTSNDFYIDCSRYIVYDSKGTLFKTKGAFPKLKVGNNTFNCTVGYKVYRRELFLI